jgi:leader peptidase (prepilin peptidase) / N-methyltransferase
VSPPLILLIGAVLGAIIGSFLATIVSRWPRGQSVVTGRSRCDGCGQSLNVLELVPLIGWLAGRGKCRRCRARIDLAHPLIEMGCLLIGGFCAWAFPPIPAALFAVGGWILLTLAVLDARHLWLPDALTLPLAALGLTLGDWFLPAPFPDRVIGAAAGATSLALLAFAYRKLRGRDGLGLGDAKLLGAIGAWMGWQALPFVLLIASGLALLWALALRATGKSIDARTRIPLGTFLCLAVVPTWTILTSIFA